MDDRTLFISRPQYMELPSKCGYCHGQKERFSGLPNLPPSASPPHSPTHIAIGCQLLQTTCADYDRFVNLGFRRSGGFLYKGDMLRGCCRMYTIRTTLGSLKISKQHRQTVNRFKKAISDGDNPQPGKGAGAGFSLGSLTEAEGASSRFHTRFELPDFSEEKYALYKKYQVSVHKDAPEDVNESQFNSFLCDSPFSPDEIEGTDAEWEALNAWASQPPAPNRPTTQVHRLGPAHECYYLDGKLIALSVLDFLPSGVSSVYFIWDPDYAHLSLGTLSVLREIYMCHTLGLGFYYLGYYIGDCTKMKYKGQFGGELLDVCAERYFPLHAVERTQRMHALPASPSSPDSPLNQFWSYDAGSPGNERFLSLNQERVPAAEPGDDQSVMVYGSSLTYVAADDALKSILANHKVSALSLPPVLPGCMPMPQILKYLSSDTSAAMKFTFYDTDRMSIFTKRFDELTSDLRATAVDFVRLFGFKTPLQAVIMY